jgi:translation initiation factor 1
MVPSEENTNEADLGDVLSELDRNEVHIVIREETRRFSKPTTLIQGVSSEKGELRRVSRELKTKLATGGNFKDGVIILQGDKREEARTVLEKLGYSAEQIEVI